MFSNLHFFYSHFFFLFFFFGKFVLSELSTVAFNDALLWQQLQLFLLLWMVKGREERRRKLKLKLRFACCTELEAGVATESDTRMQNAMQRNLLLN